MIERIKKVPDVTVLGHYEGPSILRLKIGGLAPADLVTHLSRDAYVGYDVESIIKGPGFPAPLEAYEFNAIRINLKDLFEDNVRSDHLKLHNIYARAKELGFKLCPAEAGPYLRLQFALQERGNDFFIHLGMEPISHPEGYPIIFALIANDPSIGNSLATWEVEEKYKYLLSDQFIFGVT